MEQNEINIQKPELDRFQILVDGEVDKSHEIKRYGLYAIKMAGYAAAVSGLATINALDKFVESAHVR